MLYAALSLPLQLVLAHYIGVSNMLQEGTSMRKHILISSQKASCCSQSRYQPRRPLPKWHLVLSAICSLRGRINGKMAREIIVTHETAGNGASRPSASQKHGHELAPNIWKFACLLLVQADLEAYHALKLCASPTDMPVFHQAHHEKKGQGAKLDIEGDGLTLLPDL